MPKVSIIILVYNIEKYIEKCARSLFQQTLDDLEYIFVNDCTPDNSINVIQDVLKDYPSRKNQVKIVNLEINSGQAAARKRGVLEATGEFVIFVMVMIGLIKICINVCMIVQFNIIMTLLDAYLVEFLKVIRHYVS